MLRLQDRRHLLNRRRMLRDTLVILSNGTATSSELTNIRGGDIRFHKVDGVQSHGTVHNVLFRRSEDTVQRDRCGCKEFLSVTAYLTVVR